ncbi:MAG: glycine/betaine ABC transporter substrate-binding protein [Firmicutes bacterium]|nr:glycine/betaine ABC transporter substrate-binding protein [Bacillota bacterium]
MKKKIMAAALCAVMIFALAACGQKSADEKIIVGSKGFTENLILSELYALALEDAGYQVERTYEVQNALINEALVEGEIDIYPEYTGTALMSIYQQPMESDPQKVYDTVKGLYEADGLVPLDMCAANDGQGLVITKEASEKYGIKTISDLQKKAGSIRFGSTSDFYEREDGLAGLAQHYGEFDFKSENSFDDSLKYEIMLNGEVDCVPAYTTDAQLSRDEFVLLEDDKNFWPPYNIMPVTRQDIVDDNPELAETINRISAAIDTDTMQQLNAKVDIDKEEYDDVAAEFYASL